MGCLPVKDMAKPKREKSSDQAREHSHKAYMGIRQLLYVKELVPGQKISCGDLAAKLEMSLTPVIQALKLMEIQGFVRHEPNRGYFLTPFSLEEVREIYELRLLIEPAMLPAAVSRMGKAGIEELKTAMDAHASAGEDPFMQDRLLRNVEFHLTLASLSRLDTHIRILKQIYNLLFLKYGGNYLPVAFSRSVNDEHQRIFDAVCAGNVALAQEVLTGHIAHVKERVLESAKKMSRQVDVPDF